MFCKNCGSDIKEGAAFCPKCGSGIAKKEMSFGLEPVIKKADEEVVSGKKMEIPFEKIFPVACIALAVVVVIAGIVALAVRAHQAKAEEIEYTIVGDWISADDSNLGDILTDFMEENGMGSIAGGVVKLLGFEERGKINLCFNENGNMNLGIDNIFPKVGELTYEDHGGSVMMNFSIDIDSSVSVFGLDFGVNTGPIAISYKAKYRVDQDGLLLDLFGKQLLFVPDTF